MRGLRFYSQSFTVKTVYGIREIIDCLAPEISQLYCLTQGEFLFGGHSVKGVEEVEDKYTEFLLEDQNPDGFGLKLFKPGFLTTFRDYLFGDWTDFYLVDAVIPLGGLKLWGNKIPEGCKIFISCIDGAYWEVFTEQQELLTRLNTRLPGGMQLMLEEKSV